MAAAQGTRIFPNYREILSYQTADREDISRRTHEKLRRLLLHSWRHVPYYRDILPTCGVIRGGEVKLERFSEIPILTKEIIRREGDRLYSDDHLQRRSFSNTSGGSTGLPVRFLQDKEYDEWNIATKLYFNACLGKEFGQRELKLWGSDRDILQGTLTAKDRLLNFFYNRRFFNCYRFGAAQIEELIRLNNRFQPVAYWSYMEAALELARYLQKNPQPFHSPRCLISTIGPLTEEVRKTIESALGCKVYNQYGSREVGPIACQCMEQKGLHTFPWWQYLELIGDDSRRPLTAGQGQVVISTLHNYSMPLIRYAIGDVAVLDPSTCPCGTQTLILKEVLGRTLGYFKKADGTKVHSHFLVQALFHKRWIRRFQIVQADYDRVVYQIEKDRPEEPPVSELEEILSKTRVLMGPDCQVEFEFIEQITPAASGKMMYTISQVP
jgi:phenylacetate-CoA ligase